MTEQEMFTQMLERFGVKTRQDPWGEGTRVSIVNTDNGRVKIGGSKAEITTDFIFSADGQLAILSFWAGPQE